MQNTVQELASANTQMSSSNNTENFIWQEVCSAIVV